MPNLISSLLQKTGAGGFSGRLGLALHELQSDVWHGWNEHDVFPSASTIKLPILISLGRRIATGVCAWDDRLIVRRGDHVPGSGVLKDLTDGLQVRLRDLAMLMIIQSDNTATNMLIDRIGLEALNDDFRSLGLTHSVLRRKLFAKPTGDGTDFAETSPSDLTLALSGLCRGLWLPEDLTHDLMDILARQQHRDLIPRDLPFEPYATDRDPKKTLNIANKTGFVEGVRADVAYIEGLGCRYVLTVLTADCKDLRFHPDNEASLLIGRLSHALFEHLRHGSTRALWPV